MSRTWSNHQKFYLGFLRKPKKTIPCILGYCLQPKNFRGLGLHQAHISNKAFLMKMAFNFATKPNKLWVQLLRGKYIATATILPPFPPTHHGSAIWKSIVSVWQHLQKGLFSLVLNGNNTNYWHDRWVKGLLPLSHFVPLKSNPPFRT